MLVCVGVQNLVVLQTLSGTQSPVFQPLLSLLLMTQQVIVFFQQCPDLSAFKYADTLFLSCCCITTKGLIWILFSTAPGQH